MALGTTNCLAALCAGGKCATLPNSFGLKPTPAAVCLMDGKAAVGEIAKNRLLTHPETSFEGFKRRLGHNNENFGPIDQASLVFRKLKSDLKLLGVEALDVVTPVSCAFGYSQVDAMSESMRGAGLRPRFVTDSEASALAYSYAGFKDCLALFIDLGGGTLDAALVSYEGARPRIISCAGSMEVGGDDFTDSLAQRFLKELRINSSSLDIYERAELKKSAEAAKLQLSRDPVVKLEGIFMGKSRELIISADDFITISKEHLFKVSKVLQQVFRDASTRPSRVDRCVLSGGAAKMPAISSGLSRMTGGFPIRSLPPEEVSCIGARIAAALGDQGPFLLRATNNTSLGALSYIELVTGAEERNLRLLAWGERLRQESLGSLRLQLTQRLSVFAGALGGRNPKILEEAAASLESFLKKKDKDRKNP
ncbi:MAG: Hsp70 family protein [Clostridiales bacterium]|nr:Hsp70 family protein [Clostridiales bacterium]